MAKVVLFDDDVTDVVVEVHNDNVEFTIDSEKGGPDEKLRVSDVSLVLTKVSVFRKSWRKSGAKFDSFTTFGQTTAGRLHFLPMTNTEDASAMRLKVTMSDSKYDENKFLLDVEIQQES